MNPLNWKREHQVALGIAAVIGAVLGILTGYLGSGLIDHSQKMTTAAMQIADMKGWAHRS